MSTYKGFSLLFVIIIVAAVLGAGYWYWKNDAGTLLTIPSSDTESTWLHIKEWGIDIRKPEDAPDLAYGIKKISDAQEFEFVGFSTTRLATAERSKTTDSTFYCDAKAGPGGSLTRTTHPENWPAELSDGSIHLGEYYYLYSTSQAACSEDKSVQALQSELKRGLNINGESLKENIRLHKE